MKLNSITYTLIAGIVFLFVFSGQKFLSAQARLMIGATPTYINISNGAYLVVGDATTFAAPNTISKDDAGGWIISEGDGTTNNRVKWYIGDAPAASTYTVPFGRSTTNYIPLTLTIGTPGTAGGPFIFSTYRTATYVNSANLPTTGVGPPANYYSPSVPGDASAYGIDRFWEINATNYGADKPDLSNLIFTYIDGGAGGEIDGVTASNTIVEANIQAQRWNYIGPTLGWEGGGVWPKGTADIGNDIVTLTGAAVVSGANDLTNSGWWTLIDKNKPLPVQWLRISAECNSKDVTIKWSTATEQNADYFTVERSQDGTNFHVITILQAAGNSSTVQNYSVVDTDPYSGISYYRIVQTDYNGSFTISKLMTVNGCSSGNIAVYGNYEGIYVDINAMQDGQYAIEIYDVLGQKILDEIKSVVAGNNHLKFSLDNSASAIYVVKVYNSSNSVTRKVFVRSARTE